MRRSRIVIFLVLILILLLGTVGLLTLDRQAAPLETPIIPAGAQGSSLSLILVIAGALILILLTIGIIISSTNRGSVHERLGRYTESIDEDEAKNGSFSTRMSGDSSTDAPPPDKK